MRDVAAEIGCDGRRARTIRTRGRRVGHSAVPSSPRVNPAVSVSREPADPAITESLLRSLPAWFGIEEAIVGYVDAAARLATWVARDDAGAPVGVLLAKRHFPAAAEVFLMAVDPAHHRSGVGRALMATTEDDLAADGVRLLQVKTLGPSRPDPNYARTRLFYEACGFLLLEELHGLWGENPCLVMVKTLPPSRR